MGSIFSSIVTEEMAMLAAAAIAVMLFLGRIPYKGQPLNRPKIWPDWGIFLLAAICITGSFTPGIHEIPYDRWGGILVFGMVTSMVALLGRAILKPIVISRLEGKIE